MNRVDYRRLTVLRDRSMIRKTMKIIMDLAIYIATIQVLYNNYYGKILL